MAQCPEIIKSLQVLYTEDQLLGNTTARTVGTYVSLSCHTNLVLDSPTSVVFCKSNLQWSAAIPKCVVETIILQTNSGLSKEERLWLGLSIGLAVLVAIILITLCVLFYRRWGKRRYYRQRKYRYMRRQSYDSSLPVAEEHFRKPRPAPSPGSGPGYAVPVNRSSIQSLPWVYGVYNYGDQGYGQQYYDNPGYVHHDQYPTGRRLWASNTLKPAAAFNWDAYSEGSDDPSRKMGYTDNLGRSRHWQKMSRGIAI